VSNGVYKQEADLDLLNHEWIPIRGSSSVFSGTFDGDNHTLANLKISGNNDYVGGFGYNRGTICNVHVISGSVSGGSDVGSICGRNWSDGLISECSNACSVSGGTIGGICGINFASIILCHNTGSLSGIGHAGGICGIDCASITACYNAGSISGTNYYDAGGICGSNESGTITACYNIGLVSGSGNIGGICGTDYSAIVTACYNTGLVSGGNVGGICGKNHTSSYITACYNTGSVSGSSNAGGICGENISSTITACYWKDIADDNANYGVSSPTSNTGATIFALGAWPITGTHQQWGTGDGSGNGKYWKSLGSWNGGNPIYPKLYFEE
jgi:hypothetical protein